MATALFHPRFFSIMAYKAYADLRAESEKYFASYLWWILDPLLHMCTYYVVFGVLFDRGTEDYVPFLLIGLITWRWFTSIVNEGSASVLSNKHLISQVYVPKYIFPSVCALTQTFKFLVVFTILLVFLWLYGFPLTVHLLAIPFLFFVQLLLTLGITFCIAALYPFLPDIKLLVDTGLLILFFLSGVFFSGKSIPQEYQSIFYLNPLANLIEGYRNVLMYASWPHFAPLIVAGTLGLLCVAAGLCLMQLNDRTYAKLTR